MQMQVQVVYQEFEKIALSQRHLREVKMLSTRPQTSNWKRFTVCLYNSVPNRKHFHTVECS